MDSSAGSVGPGGTVHPTSASDLSSRKSTTLASSADHRDESAWLDRDLGWIEFNRRVLAEAMDQRTPLLERVKFLAIFTSNLDEFFMKRIAVLREHLTDEHRRIISRVREQVVPLVRQQADYFQRHVIPELAANGIHVRRWAELTADQQAEASRYFDTQVSAALTPLVIRPSEPFPFFSNLSLSLAFALQDQLTGESVDARVKVPAELRQWVPLTAGVSGGQQLLVSLCEIIRANAHKLYPGMRLEAPTVFRLTRDAEVAIADAPDGDLREQVRAQIRQRRYEPAVRLEFSSPGNDRLKRMLQESFGLSSDDLYDLPEFVDAGLFEISSLELPALRDTAWTPVTPPRLAAGASMFEVIRSGDVFVHHPYESFDQSVERFIREAADDKQTVAVKMTVYRVGDDTPFVRSLIAAAEAGKQVACVIELKARFDEERNLHWAAQLEQAGAHVTVGNAALKTHAKLALVVRREDSGLRVYAHIGTGNYHVRTARLYADVGLFTCDPAITGEVVTLFHHLTGRSEPPAFERLLVAPQLMRTRFQELIDREIQHRRAGRPARIVAKMNQVEDPPMMEALCDASRAGVPIDLIVRGFCCLAPGVPGVSDTIRVRSIIGRFLEHSRVFHFANGRENPIDGDFFLGSADWMGRNLSDRVEVVTPVGDRTARERLWEILDLQLKDTRSAWEMRADGSYTQLRADTTARTDARGTHQALMELVAQRAQSQPAEDTLPACREGTPDREKASAASA
jgi:polyphosphate kinase